MAILHVIDVARVAHETFRARPWSDVSAETQAAMIAEVQQILDDAPDRIPYADQNQLQTLVNAMRHLLSD